MWSFMCTRELRSPERTPAIIDEIDCVCIDREVVAVIKRNY